jgi:DNA invertase Pin-like site-specific DNA recombinase
MPAIRDHSEIAPHSFPTPVAIYARVSTEQQCGHRFDSCEHQVAVCREYILKQAHLGWHEVACFIDEAYSGSNLERPGIRALMAEINAGAIKIVLIYKLERLLRSTFEWSRLSRFLEERGCRLISPNEDHTDVSASGRLKTNILVSFAEYERLNVAEKIRSKMLAQAKRGMWGGGVVPYGFDYDREQQRLLPNAKESVIVKRLYERAAILVPLGEIAAELNASGLRSRSRIIRDAERNRRSIGSRPFRADAIRMLLRNPVYRGFVRYGGKEFRGQHEALVPVETWELANAAIKQTKQAWRVALRAHDKYANLLKGLLVCGCCGLPLLSKASGKIGEGRRRYRYYSCRRRYQEEGVAQCALENIAAGPFESAVVGFLGRVGAQERVVESLIGDSSGTLAQRRLHESQLALTENRLLKLKVQVENCVDVLAEEGIRAFTQDLSDRIGDLGEKRQALLVQREQQRQRIEADNKCTLGRERIRHAIVNLGRVLPTLPPAEQQSLLWRVLDSVAVDSTTAENQHTDLRRKYHLTFKFRLTDFVAAMERNGFGDDRTEKTAPFAQRLLPVTAEILLGSKGRITVCAPFGAEIGARPPEAPVVKAPAQNPIRRAMRWQAELQENPDLSVRALARHDGVSAALVCLHLKLLQLPAEVVAFVQRLDTPAALRLFSFRKLTAMSKCGPKEQLERFKIIRRELPPE